MNKKNIIEIVSKHVKVSADKIKDESSTETIDTWDSLAHIRIIMELEKLTNIKIQTSDFGEYNSIKKLTDKFS
tara:strand:+ start:770 stop:988 length:219 start_codon:yes stop_codon:yes gene_type:complete